MANLSHDSATDRGSPPPMPRWVKIPGIIVGILLLVVILLRVTGINTKHGPGHEDPIPDSAPASVTQPHLLPTGGLG